MTTLVIAEHDNATLKGSTLNTVTAAVQVGGDVHVLVAGSNAGIFGDGSDGSATLDGTATVAYLPGSRVAGIGTIAHVVDETVPDANRDNPDPLLRSSLPKFFLGVRGDERVDVVHPHEVVVVQTDPPGRAHDARELGEESRLVEPVHTRTARHRVERTRPLDPLHEGALARALTSICR